jgi:amino acid transporter
MRIFKYIVFISILSGIFFVIYRQSDKKGFRRWWTSFKTAIIFSAIAAGLIPVNPEAIEPPGNNNQVYQERLLSDQEFNSFEDNDQKVILVKTGDSSFSVPTSPGRGQPSQFPTPPV